MRLFSILLFCLAATEVTGLTKFHFKGQLLCNMQEFRYRITVWEDDWKYDNPIGHVSPVFSYYPHFWTAEAEDTDDGFSGWLGWLDTHFEVYIVIVHSCTNNTNGKYKKLTVDLGTFPIVDGDLYGTYNIDLNEAGEDTIDVIGTKKHFDGHGGAGERFIN